MTLGSGVIEFHRLAEPAQPAAASTFKRVCDLLRSSAQFEVCEAFLYHVSGAVGVLMSLQSVASHCATAASLMCSCQFVLDVSPV
jgi:hypothetical protein